MPRIDEASKRLKGLAGYGLILVAAFALAGGVALKSAADQTAALKHYRQTGRDRLTVDTARVSQSFNEIYQGLRTIGQLPGVRAIDRHGKNLDANANAAIDQIYFSMTANVNVSEIYIVPVTLQPEQIDTETGSLEIPILMFDGNIAGAGEAEDEEKITTIDQAEHAKEVEIYEYRLLHDQMTYLRRNYPTQGKNLASLPMISGPSVLTCDNSVFDQTHNDADRTGIIVSVPFYGPDGQLKGTISAILRNKVVAALLPDKNYALVNPAYNIGLLTAGQATTSSQYALKNKPDPSLLFSGSQSLSIPDPISPWSLWTALPNSSYYMSSDYRAIKAFQWMAYGAISLLTLAALFVYGLIRRNMRIMSESQAGLEAGLAAERANVEQLYAAQDRAREADEVRRRQDMSHVAKDFETSVGGIIALVASAATEMQTAAAQLSDTAGKTSAQSSAVSEAAVTAGNSVASVAAAAEELGASVREISRQIETSGAIAREAVVDAKAASQIVIDLNDVASSIGGVVDLIAGLASQTNLLALNATIESARAGEAGRGFAVVASEVKALAAQTSNATTDISNKIGHIQAASARAAAVMEKITSTIHDIDQSSIAIASAVSQQAAATSEIAKAVHLASNGTQEVTANISGVAVEAEYTGAAATQVLHAANELAADADRLHNEMDKFLANVRTG